jgi:mannose-6-phosphate isomerase-like protein (cupin superfamily)
VSRSLPRSFALLAALSAPGAAAVAQATGSTPGPQAVVDTTWHVAMSGPIPLLRRITGVRAEPGPFREYYQTPAGTSTGAHRHTADMHIHVISGRQFILMGDLENARVQRFDAGSTFVIPAGTWHVEWFEEDTLVELFGVGPMRTERPPAVRRTSMLNGSSTDRTAGQR